MNKPLIIVAVLLVAVFGYFLFSGDTVDYVATIDDEVTELEAELAEIEAAVTAGTLTPEAAAEAQTRIATRLESINQAVDAGQRSGLTASQRTMLQDGLERLRQTLVNYQATLTAVDDAVMELPEAERPRLRSAGSGGARNPSLADVIAATIDNVEDYVEDVVDDYESPEEVSTTTEGGDEDVSADDAEMDSGSDDTMSDDESADDATSSEETVSEEETEEANAEPAADDEFNFSDEAETEEETVN